MSIHGAKALKAVRAAITLPLLTEHQEQCTVVDALEKMGLAFFAIPNFRALDATGFALATHLRKEGVRKGVPDIFICEPRGEFHGLFVEMKRVKGSKHSDDQEWWALRLQTRGYRSIVAYGATQAIEAIQTYLRGNK